MLDSHNSVHIRFAVSTKLGKWCLKKQIEENLKPWPEPVEKGVKVLFSIQTIDSVTPTSRVCVVPQKQPSYFSCGPF